MRIKALQEYESIQCFTIYQILPSNAKNDADISRPCIYVLKVISIWDHSKRFNCFLISGPKFSTRMTNKVSIFFTSDGVEWAGYLQDKLSCKDCNINTELVNLSNKDIDFLSKVNVFLVSPDFLELKSWDILNKFDSKTAIAVLAGVDHNDWIEATGKHNIETVLEWLDYELEASDRSVRDLLVTIIGIYEIQEEFGDDPDADWNNYMNVPSDKPNEADSFYKVLPSRPCRPVNAVTNVFRKVMSHRMRLLYFSSSVLILQTRVRSHPVGLGVWYLIDPSSISVLHVCESRRLWWDCANAQARLTSLVAYVISTIISLDDTTL